FGRGPDASPPGRNRDATSLSISTMTRKPRHPRTRSSCGSCSSTFKRLLLKVLASTIFAMDHALHCIKLMPCRTAPFRFHFGGTGHQCVLVSFHCSRSGFGTPPGFCSFSTGCFHGSSLCFGDFQSVRSRGSSVGFSLLIAVLDPVTGAPKVNARIAAKFRAAGLVSCTKSLAASLMHQVLRTKFHARRQMIRAARSSSPERNERFGVHQGRSSPAVHNGACRG